MDLGSVRILCMSGSVIDTWTVNAWHAGSSVVSSKGARLLADSPLHVTMACLQTIIHLIHKAAYNGGKNQFICTADKCTDMLFKNLIWLNPTTPICSSMHPTCSHRLLFISPHPTFQEASQFPSPNLPHTSLSPPTVEETPKTHVEGQDTRLRAFLPLPPSEHDRR